MVRQVWRDVVHLSIDRRPCVIARSVLLQHGRRHSQKRVRALKAHHELLNHLLTEQTNDERTRRFCPDFFRLAQSSGPCPGARATFPRFAGCGGGFVVVGGTSKDDDVEESPELTGRLVASEGGGGGGMSCVSVNIRGTASACAAR